MISLSFVFHFPASSIWFRRGPPTVVTLHDISPLLIPEVRPPSFAMRWYMRRIYAAIRRRAAHVITDSESSRADIERVLRIPARRLASIPLGVSPNSVSVAEENPEPVLEPYFLYVGALDGRKNIPGMLEGFRRFLEREKSRHVLVLAGHSQPSPGARYLDPREILATHPSAERLRFLGEVSESRLDALYRGAVATLLVSLYEGFGFPILESFACGTPVIASNRSSCPEVAGNAGLLVDPDDPDAIAGALARLASDPAERKRLADLGRLRTRAFTWETTARRTIEIYESVARERAP